MLPNVPMQALSRMLPTSVKTSRDDGSRSIDSAGTSVSSSVSVAAATGSRISSASPATGPLKTWCTLATRSSTSLPSDWVKWRDRVDRDLRHVEQHALLRQLRQRRAGAAEADVQQLDERVVLNGVEFHSHSPSVERTSVSTSLASTGLTRNPAAPPCATSSCDEVCTSAETTMTRACGIHLAQPRQHLEAVHPLHDQVEQHDVRLRRRSSSRARPCRLRLR